MRWNERAIIILTSLRAVRGFGWTTGLEIAKQSWRDTLLSYRCDDHRRQEQEEMPPPKCIYSTII